MYSRNAKKEKGLLDIAFESSKFENFCLVSFLFHLSFDDDGILYKTRMICQSLTLQTPVELKEILGTYK